MAVFTAAALAVSAAVATTTVATVATAVVAVSAAVGVAGLAVTAVGLVTKNESLLKAGKIMGYVGLAGGLAGGAIGGIGAMSSGGSFVQGAADAFAGASQFMKEGWDSGVGQLFAGGDKVAGPLGGADQSLTSATDKLASTNSQMSQALTPPQTTAPTDMASAVNQPSADVLASQQAAMSPAPPVATPAPSVVSAPSAPLAGTNPIPGYVGPGAAPIPGAAPAASPGLFGNMPEWAKYSMMTTAGQGLSGLASGYFTGLQAEEALKQKQLENQQTQNQIQLLNRQGSYAPLVQFRGPGLVQTGGR
jgi:hypothetical protein